jgi:hypothetical protein
MNVRIADRAAIAHLRPQFTGFGPDITHQLPRTAAALPEQPMTIISDNANRIVDLITENGGSMSGNRLRMEVADLSPLDRRKAIGKLREEGRIVSTGATTRVTYYLPGQKRRQEEPPSAAPLKDVRRDVADNRTERTVPAPPSPPICVHVPIPDNVAPELQLMAALDFITDKMFLQHFGVGLDYAHVERATAWLASKYQVPQT